VFAQIELRDSGEVSVCWTSNISAGGLYIERGEGELAGVRAGDQITVYLDLGNDHEGQSLELQAPAEVVRVDDAKPGRRAGVALMWVSEDPGVAQQLARVLQHVRAR
jgi:hypothetical protein